MALNPHNTFIYAEENNAIAEMTKPMKSSSLTVNLWYISEVDYEVHCMTWCTEDGKMPVKPMQQKPNVVQQITDATVRILIIF